MMGKLIFAELPSEQRAPGQEGLFRQQQLPAGHRATDATSAAGAPETDLEQQGEAEGEHRGGQQP